MANFDPLGVVCRGSETQLQVSENLNYLIERFKGSKGLKGFICDIVYITFLIIAGLVSNLSYVYRNISVPWNLDIRIIEWWCPPPPSPPPLQSLIIKVKKKVKMQVIVWYKVLKNHQPTLHFAPWSLDLYIRVPFHLHWDGEHTVLQPFRHIKLIVHIAISVQVLIHTWVKWRAFEGKAPCQRTQHRNNRHNTERREAWYFSENPETNHCQAVFEITWQTATLAKAPRSDHCALSLSAN